MQTRLPRVETRMVARSPLWNGHTHSIQHMPRGSPAALPVRQRSRLPGHSSHLHWTALQAFGACPFNKALV